MAKGAAMSALAVGDGVKRRGDDGRPTGPAMVILRRSPAISNYVAWECQWCWNGALKHRAFIEAMLLLVGKPVERLCDTEVPA
jgi:hypothetical protein